MRVDVAPELATQELGLGGEAPTGEPQVDEHLHLGPQHPRVEGLRDVVGATCGVAPVRMLLVRVDERVACAEEYLELERGDLLVTVTDGVLEGRDGPRMLGEHAFESELAKAADLPAQTVAEHVRQLALDFVSGPHRDDMAVFVLRLPPASAVRDLLLRPTQ